MMYGDRIFSKLTLTSFCGLRDTGIYDLRNNSVAILTHSDHLVSFRTGDPL